MNIVIFVIILFVLILVHEFGHFFTAKRFGIRVDEFGFGFPPKIFGFKKGETEYTLNLLPIGGFVRIFGETPDEESLNGPDRERSFTYKAKWKQAVVLFAGVFMNLLLAWFLFSLGFISGLPTSVDNAPKNYEVKDSHLVAISVMEDSPAFKAGLQSGDRILEVVSGEDVALDVSPQELKTFITTHSESEIAINYQRGKSSEKYTAKVVPENGLIGISMDKIGTAKLPVFKAFWEGLRLTIFTTKATLLGLFELIGDGLRGEGSMSSITGPVGLVGIAGDAYQFGLVYLMSFTALISINLAIINLLPFPALDGGRLFFLLIEKLKGSRINPKVANTANLIGFGILIFLMLVVTYHDVVKLF